MGSCSYDRPKFAQNIMPVQSLKPQVEVKRPTGGHPSESSLRLSIFGILSYFSAKQGFGVLARCSRRLQMSRSGGEVPWLWYIA